MKNVKLLMKKLDLRRSIEKLKVKNYFLGGVLLIVWDTLKALKFNFKKKISKFQIRLKYGVSKLFFNRLCWINPKEIQYCVESDFDKNEDFLHIIDGNWDNSNRLFEDLDIFQSFKQRYAYNKNWDETEFYHRVLNQISRGIKKWGCETKEGLDNRVRTIDALYSQIKKNGFKSRKELNISTSWFGKIAKPEYSDEIALMVGRKGELLFFDGRHRLSIAKLLKIPEIPIKIIARHKKWMAFRYNFLLYSKNELKKKFSHSLKHPDLQDIPIHEEDSIFKIIKKNLTLTCGSLLDLSAKLGYICHRFDTKGYNCLAFEKNPHNLYFLKMLKIIEKWNFKIIEPKLLEKNMYKNLDVDIILILDIFGDYFTNKESNLLLIKILSKFKPKELLIGINIPNNFQKIGYRKNLTSKDILNLITETSNLNTQHFIGEANDGTLFYKFTA
ncbi:MAG: hypothetical protein ACFFCE_10635 [Promethearchaeota archaeon]